MNMSESVEYKKRDHILGGKVGEDTIHSLVEKIIEINRFDERQLEKDKNYVAKPINIYINSIGGSMYDANFLIGVIQTSKTPVHTYAGGKIMSAGLYIFVAGHKRFTYELSTFMYHDGTVGLHNTIEGLKSDYEHQVNVRDRYDDYIARRTQLPKTVMDEMKKYHKDFYLNAEQAVEYGVAHEILKELA
ncbi:ATP-dependent Clp protease proteolytic subunit [Bacillus phage PK-3]|nr:ATP-dependent Clp protease proteolytic subunit [Bacillus phage PK-3]